ncbi:MAG: response regulator [Vicinamibacterales bacterium]
MPSPCTILIVDDSPDALGMWEMYLRAEGFAVLTALDGVAAISLATERRPDLILLDLELPGHSGTDVATILRGQASTRHIPLVAVTGHSHRNQLDLARQVGFDAIMIKPCDPISLLNEIRRLLPPPAAHLATGDGNGDTPRG